MVSHSPGPTSPNEPGSPADERYRPLFALSPQPAWVYDRNTLEFLEVNEAAVRSYGWSRAEFLAMSIRDIRTPSELAHLDALLDEARQDPHHSAASTHRTKSGVIRKVIVSTYALDFDGHPARMVLVQDITDRDAAVEALAQSEQKYRSVIEQLRDVFFRTDSAGNWTFLNQAWTSLTGNDVEHSLGTHFLSYVHPSDRTMLLDAFRPLGGGEQESSVVEVRYFHRDGGYRWVEATTHAVKSTGGQLIGTMGTLRDVTERRATNEERQRLETNIRQLLDASGEGIYGLDARGVITFVNRRGSELLGYKPVELVGQPIHELAHHSRPGGAHYPREDCPITRAASEGIPCEVSDDVMWHKDGSPVHVEYAASPLKENGQYAGAVVNFRDISARRRAELELIVARDAAEAASRAKSDFLARMSHELRTPLNSIIGFANVLRKNKQGDMGADDLSYLQRIATNGLHLLGVINDILDISKIEAGRMTLEVGPVMLDTLVRETIEELEGQTRGRDVRLVAEIPSALRSMQTDAVRMKQVLINLIGNALKFTEVGEVTVIIEAGDDGAPRKLLVRDSGIGIPQERLDAIFNVFEQAEAMTSRRYGGSGLGLAISRSLCELMGHRLDVESTVGEGTTMSIRLGDTPSSSRQSLPRGMPSIPAPAAMRPAPRVEEQPLVLVVDDDDDARLLLGHPLEEAGCRVAYAETGIEGLRMARELLPALIFLDLRLPKISGFDVLRILIADETLRATPVIIASVVGSESRNVLQGAADILDKPISREQVMSVVRRWVPGAARQFADS